MRVCQLVTNPYTFDTRVRKQCESLVRLGCEVVVIGVHRKGMPLREKINGVKVIRVVPGEDLGAAFKRLVGDNLRSRIPRGPLFGGMIRGARYAARQARRARSLAGRVVGRFKRMFRRRPATLESALAAARATEARFPFKDHLRFWLGPLLAVLLLPVALIVLLLSAVVAAIVGVVRSAWRAIASAWKGLIKTWRKRFDKAMGQPLYKFSRIVCMLAEAYDADANVYQANDPDTLRATSLAARLQGVRFVYDIHELYDESFPTRKPFRERYWIRHFEKKLGGRASHRITVGENIARVMSERYGWEKPVVLQNAQVYEGAPEPDAYIRQQIDDMDCRRMVFVYAGRITRGRGIIETARAFEEIDGSRAALVIMGNADPKYLKEVHFQVRKRGLGDRVYVLDPVESDRLPSVLQCADMGLMLTQPVCLSYYYGLGNKMFHYVNSGLGVLASAHPEKQQFVETHGVGTCVADIRPEPIRDAIQHLLDNPHLVAAMKARAREVAPYVSWQAQERRYLDIYTSAYEDMLFNIKGAA